MNLLSEWTVTCCWPTGLMKPTFGNRFCSPAISAREVVVLPTFYAGNNKAYCENPQAWCVAHKHIIRTDTNSRAVWLQLRILAADLNLLRRKSDDMMMPIQQLYRACSCFFACWIIAVSIATTNNFVPQWHSHLEIIDTFHFSSGQIFDVVLFIVAPFFWSGAKFELQEAGWRLR